MFLKISAGFVMWTWWKRMKIRFNNMCRVLEWINERIDITDKILELIVETTYDSKIIVSITLFGTEILFKLHKACSNISGQKIVQVFRTLLAATKLVGLCLGLIFYLWDFVQGTGHNERRLLIGWFILTNQNQFGTYFKFRPFLDTSSCELTRFVWRGVCYNLLR